MATPTESIPGILSSGNLLVVVDNDKTLSRLLQLTTSGAVFRSTCSRPLASLVAGGDQRTLPSWSDHERRSRR